MNREAQLELVDAIYRAATDDLSWDQVCNLLAEEVNFAGVIFHGYHSAIKYQHFATSNSWDAADIQTYGDYFHSVSPWIGDHFKRPTGELYLASELTPRLDIDHPEFYNDWAQPAGRGAGAALKLLDTETSYAVITLDYEFKRSASLDPVALEFLAPLAPHLRRAFSIQSRLNHLDQSIGKFEKLLNRSNVPLFLVDASGHIDWMNESAETAARRQRGIRIDPRGNLRFMDSSVHEAAISVLRKQSDPACQCCPTPLPILPIATGDPTDLGYASVIPMPTTIAKPLGPTPQHRMLITLRYASDKDVPCPRLVESMMGLTRAESEVAVELAKGLTVWEIAKKRSVSKHTVRNQVKRCLVKTDSRQQSDLVRGVLALGGTIF